MHTTQNSFHPTNLLSQTSRSFNIINNRPPLMDPNRTSPQHLYHMSSTNFHSHKLDGSQIKRLQVQTQIKRRYQKMIELQHKNFIQRHQLQTEREEQLKKEQSKVQSKTKQIRLEMLQLGQSTRDWHHRNRCEGAELRHQRVINHRIRVQRDTSQLQRKKQAVSQHHRSFRMRSRHKKAEGEKVSLLE